MLIESEENVKLVQRLMGHSSSKMTLDKYARASTVAKRKALGRLIEPAVPPSAMPELSSAMVQ